MKLEVGKQYKTRDGGRAVVVDEDKNDKTFLVWHENMGNTRWHDKDGKEIGYNKDKGTELISEWTEPKSGTVWANVNYGGVYVYLSKEKADQFAHKDRLACVRVEWVEGQDDE